MNVAKTMAEKPWRASWPASIPEDVDASALPDVPWKGQIARYRKIFQALDGAAGATCNVSDARDLLRRMEAWSDRHAAHFSWPPSHDGWVRAVWATMAEPQGKEDMAWLWAVYGPSVKVALSDKPAPHSWASALLRAAAPAPPAVSAAPPPPAPQPAPHSTSHDAAVVDPKVAHKDQPIKEREVSPEVRRTRDWLVNTLSALTNGREPHGVIAEKFDRALKEAIDQQARAGTNRVAGWIEYNFLPAVVGLDAEKMSMLADLWPSSQSRSFIDPQKTVASKKFWAIVDEPSDQEAKAIFMDRVLPAVIDASEWPATQRYAMAVEMLEWTKRRPAVFRDRLRLWQAWGGRMDDVASAPQADGNMFSKSQAAPETVEGWIRKQAIPEWDAAIAPHLRSQRRP